MNFKISAISLMMMVFAVSASTADNKTISLTVDEAVKKAISDNPQVNESETMAKSAEQVVKKARADLFAKASLNYSYNGLEKTPVMKQGAGEVPVSHRNIYHFDVTLAQPIFTGFALTSNLKISKLGLKASLLQKDLTLLDLARDVKSACYQLLLAGKMLKVANEEVKALESHRDKGREFYAQGLIPRNDLLKSEVALSSAVQEQETARATVKNGMAIVNMLMNEDLGREIVIKEIKNVSQATSYLYESLVAEAVRMRPELSILRIQKRQAELGKTLAASAYYPVISAVGRYERNGDSPGISDNDFENESNSSISLQAEWKFFEWGKTRADVLSAGYKTRALVQAIRNVENGIALEVNNALLNLKVAEKNICTAMKSLGQAEENWRITKAQYAEQVATSTDVLDARTFLTRADTNYYGALYGYMIYHAELERAVGKR